MKDSLVEHIERIFSSEGLSTEEREELAALAPLVQTPPTATDDPPAAAAPAISPLLTAIRAPSVLNEAPRYGAAFSRGVRLEFERFSLLLISGTASVDEDGDSAHLGDFRAQCWRTYRNIATLLESEGASWKDVVKTTCYLRDIERDYAAFNKVRADYFRWQEIDPLPASVGIQARLCRSDLLIEIEAIAIRRKSSPEN